MADVTLTEEENALLWGSNTAAWVIQAVERIVAARVAAAEREALERARHTRIDVCANCGDLVIADGDADYWAHYRGPGSRLNRCQHTVPYGYDATPAHDGAYFVVRDLMPRKDGE